MAGRLLFLLALVLSGNLSMGQPSFPVWDRIVSGGEDDMIGLGERLLSELHCTGCHASGTTVEAGWPQVTASDLSLSRRWFREEYLSLFLADPHAADSATAMPDLLEGKTPSERREVSAALQAFLQVTGEEERGEVRPREGSRRRGKALFHSVGCTACHRSPRHADLDSSEEELLSEDGIRLDRLEQRYHWTGLVEFLSHRRSGHARGSAPGLKLSATEARDLSSYLLPERRADPTRDINPPADFVAKGRQLFDRLSCGQCHELGGSEFERRELRRGLPFESLTDLRGACLSEVPRPGVPEYRLGEKQREALRLAIERRQGTKTGAPRPSLDQQLVRLRCYACHTRDGKGGAPLESSHFFEALVSDMGDEGRVPPSLSGVGRKLRLSAMEAIISGDASFRPYMITRMPAYDPALAKTLARALAASDIPQDEQPTVREHAENQVGRNMWGRALMGLNGLACVSCHGLGGHESLGIPFMDLAHAPQRLRPEWFRDYLLDPASFRPGTRMPAFWPSGQPSVKGFGGSSERQIDSLWVYLNEFDQSRLPEGLVDEKELLLVPGDRPVVFRTFLKGVGNHAIAVGTSTRIHAAFDAQSVRLAIAWEGDFLDAGSTWDDRFTPLADPLGDKTFVIQALGHGDDRSVEFRGYVLDPESGVPSFQYRIGDMTVADEVMGAAVEGRRLRRRVTLMDSNQTGHWLDVASGESVVPSGETILLSNGVRISSSADLRIVEDTEGVRVQVYLPEASRDEPVRVDYDW